MCDRANGVMYVAIYVKPADEWTVGGGAALVETEKNLLINFPSIIPIYIDSEGMPVYAVGSLNVQFKLQNGMVSSAKMKVLAMSYWQTVPGIPEGNIQRFGALKMKAQKIDQNELPIEVQAMFGLAP